MPNNATAEFQQRHKRTLATMLNEIDSYYKKHKTLNLPADLQTFLKECPGMKELYDDNEESSSLNQLLNSKVREELPMEKVYDAVFDWYFKMQSDILGVQDISEEFWEFAIELAPAFLQKKTVANQPFKWQSAAENVLLQQCFDACPLEQVDREYQFVHPSLVAYFVNKGVKEHSASAIPTSNPVPVKMIQYTERAQGATHSTRKILVINGIPFYLSTGTSEDNETMIGSTWRENLWMPMVGVNVKAGKEGQFIKLGSHIKRNSTFENEIGGILTAVFKSMDESTRDGILKSLMKEKYLKVPYEYDAGAALSDLKDQLTRYGTFEAMMISMKISPQQMEKNELLKKFMGEVSKKFPQFRNDLPSVIKNAVVDQTIFVRQDDKDDRIRGAEFVNDWLLKTIIKEIDHTQALLCRKLTGELNAFRKRRGLKDDHEYNKLDHSALSRNTVVAELERKIVLIAKEAKTNLRIDNIHTWKQEYEAKLTQAVESSLNDKQLDKYGFFQKLGITLLNIITVLFSPIKKQLTGSYFFSTTGKSKEAVEEVKQIVKTSAEFKGELGTIKEDSSDQPDASAEHGSQPS